MAFLIYYKLISKKRDWDFKRLIKKSEKRYVEELRKSLNMKWTDRAQQLLLDDDLYDWSSEKYIERYIKIEDWLNARQKKKNQRKKERKALSRKYERQDTLKGLAIIASGIIGLGLFCVLVIDPIKSNIGSEALETILAAITLISFSVIFIVIIIKQINKSTDKKKEFRGLTWWFIGSIGIMLLGIYVLIECLIKIWK